MAGGSSGDRPTSADRLRQLLWVPAEFTAWFMSKSELSDFDIPTKLIWPSDYEKTCVPSDGLSGDRSEPQEPDVIDYIEI